jgi:hypothetical protein
MSMPRGFLFWGRKVDEPLCVEVDGTSIIVTMPGTDFSVTYQKEIDAPHLVLTHMGSATSTNHEFRARAFHAAVEKARELSWIV